MKGLFTDKTPEQAVSGNINSLGPTPFFKRRKNTI